MIITGIRRKKLDMAHPETNLLSEAKKTKNKHIRINSLDIKIKLTS